MALPIPPVKHRNLLHRLDRDPAQSATQACVRVIETVQNNLRLIRGAGALLGRRTFDSRSDFQQQPPSVVVETPLKAQLKRLADAHHHHADTTGRSLLQQHSPSAAQAPGSIQPPIQVSDSTSSCISSKRQRESTGSMPYTRRDSPHSCRPVTGSSPVHVDRSQYPFGHPSRLQSR